MFESPGNISEGTPANDLHIHRMHDQCKYRMLGRALFLSDMSVNKVCLSDAKWVEFQTDVSIYILMD